MPYLGSHIHSLQGNPTFQTLYLESYIHSLQVDPTSQTLYLGSHICSFQDNSPLWPCNWGHMSTVSRVPHISKS